jgi:NAD-dependent dihydropyrimidine dehydrogenase PreA subunit
MIASPKTAVRVALYEGEGSRPLPAQLRFEVSRTLLEKGYAVSSIRAGGRVSGTGSGGNNGSLIVLGQFTEQKPAHAVADDGASQVYFGEIGNLEPAQVLSLVEAACGEAQLPKPGGWKPWFPVIDYDRCTNCMQCLSFCLFDVYGVTINGKIQVRSENNCKTDCPACSRVCPEVAILFPKYRSGPINGDEINPEDLRREAMKVDISSLLGGDIYQALRDRSEKAKSRFSKERDDERALKERQRCLSKLQEQMEIPAEVLASLPSIDQIQARAAQAKQRAAEAVQANATAGQR